MEFDHFSVALLRVGPNAASLSEEEAARIRDGHLSHLADLHEAGHLLAAGPLAFDDPDESLCGLSILTVGVEEARALKQRDPGVQAGMFTVEVLPWMVPRGAVSYSRTHFPRSAAEAR